MVNIFKISNLHKKNIYLLKINIGYVKPITWIGPMQAKYPETMT